jgi:hypothetical protein
MVSIITYRIRSERRKKTDTDTMTTLSMSAMSGMRSDMQPQTGRFAALRALARLLRIPVASSNLVPMYSVVVLVGFSNQAW